MIFIILIMIILNIIYHSSGLLSVFAFIVWSINLFATTMILIQNPSNFWIKIVQIISILNILIIIYLNISLLYDSLYKFSFIIPLSVNKITYLEDIYEENQLQIIYLRTGFINRFYFNDAKEISDFLENLEENKSYLITFELILSWTQHEDGYPVINLSKPFLITKNSNPHLISNFIKERIGLACDSYLLNEDIIDMMVGPDTPGIIVKYSQIKILFD